MGRLCHILAGTMILHMITGLSGWTWGKKRIIKSGVFLMDPNFGIGFKDWIPEAECLSTDRDLLLAVGNGMNDYYYEFVDLEPELE